MTESSVCDIYYCVPLVSVFCDGRVEAGDGYNVVWADKQGSHSPDSPAVIVQDWDGFGKIILSLTNQMKLVKAQSGRLTSCYSLLYFCLSTQSAD